MLGNSDQMYVIRHQAVAQQGYAVMAALGPQNVDVEALVLGEQEYVLAVVAPLGDVVRNALHGHSSHSRHVALLTA